MDFYILVMGMNQTGTSKVKHMYGFFLQLPLFPFLIVSYFRWMDHPKKWEWNANAMGYLRPVINTKFRPGQPSPIHIHK